MGTEYAKALRQERTNMCEEQGLEYMKRETESGARIRLAGLGNNGGEFRL